MLMLKTILSSWVFIINEVFAIDKISGIKDGDELIEKSGKLSKTEKLLKNLKLSKF